MLDKNIVALHNATNNEQNVAHHLQLPIEINLQALPARWTPAEAEYIGWYDEYYGAPTAVLRVTSPAKYAGLVDRVLPEKGLPPEILERIGLRKRKRYSREIYRERRAFGNVQVLIRDVPENISTNPFDDNGKPLDAWKARDEFLRLQEPGSLLRFLNRYGHWYGNVRPEVIAYKKDWEEGWQFRKTRFHDFEQEWYVAKKPHSVADIVLPEEIWFISDNRRPTDLRELARNGPQIIEVREVLKWGMSCGPDAWLSSGYRGEGPSGPRSDFPHYWLTTSTVLDAIFASITIDYLRGTKFRVCARPDCALPFALQSRHKRIFCTQYCGHLESVRRKRAVLPKT